MKMKCGKCGCFVSLKNRWLKGCCTAIIIWCKRCGVNLTVGFDSYN